MMHTVNLAVAPILTVFDDRGAPVYALMLPICLIVTLPCVLWQEIRRMSVVSSQIKDLWSDYWLLTTSIFSPDGWREDLALMGRAVLGLFEPEVSYA